MTTESDNRFDPNDIAFERGEVIPVSASGLSDDDRIVIRWKVHFGLAEEAKQWAYTYRRTFSDEIVSFRKLEGPYRSLHIECKHEPGSKVTYLDHYFAKGWAQTVLSGAALDWSGFRLVDRRELPSGSVNPTPPVSDTFTNPEQYLLFRMEGIDPEKAYAVQAEVEGLTANAFAPEVEGETYGNGFTRLYCRCVRDWNPGNDDKAATLDILVAKPRWQLSMTDAVGTKKQSKFYYLFNVPKYIAQSIVNLYNTSVGSTIRSSGESEDGLTDLTVRYVDIQTGFDTVITAQSCSRKETSYFYHNVVAAVAAPAGSSGIEYDSSWSLSDETGLWSGVIRKIEAITISMAEWTARINSAETEKIRRWLNALDDGSGGYKDHNGETISLPSMSVEVLKEKRLEKQKNPNCTTDISYDENAVADQTGSAAEESAARSVVSATHTQGNLLAAAPTPGSIVRVESRPTRFGKYDNQSTVETPKNQSATEWEKSSADSTVRAKETEGIAATEPVATTGVIVRTMQDPTEAGNSKKVVETTTAIDQTGSQYEDSAAKNVTATTHTQGSALTPPLASVGTVVRRRSDPTRFGLNQTVSEVDTAKDQTGAAYEESASRSVNTSTHTNYTALPAPASTPGSIKRRRSAPNEYGLNQTEDTTETPKDQSRISYEDSAARAVVSVSHTESGTPLSSASATPGTILRRDNRPTEAGNTETSDQVVTVKDQTGSEYRETGTQSVVTARHTENATPLAPPAFVSGSIVTRRSDPTEAGRNQTVDETSTAKNQSRTSYEEDGEKSTTRAEDTQSTVAGTPAWTPGTIKRVTNEPTEYDLTRKVVETVTVKDQSRTSTEESAARTSSSVAHTQSTPASVAWTPGTIVRARNEPTQADKTASAVETVTAKDQTGTEYRESGEESLSVATHTEGSALPAPGFSTGTIITRRNEPTEYGLNRTVDETSTAKDQSRSSYEEDGSRSVERVEHTHSPIPITTPAWTPGTLKRAGNAPTRYDTTQTVVETTTVKDQSRSSAEETGRASTTRTVHTESPTSATAAWSPGRLVRSSNDPTQADRTRTVAEITEVKDQTGSEYSDSGARSSVVSKHTESATPLPAPSATPGTIVNRRNDPTESGLNQTSDEVITAKNQSRTSYEEDGAKSLARVESTQSATPAPPPAWIAGTISRSSNDPTEFDRTRTIVETLTVKDQGRMSIEESGTRRVVRNSNTEATVSALPSWLAGTIVRGSNEPTQADRTRAVEEIVTVKNQARTSYEEDGTKATTRSENTEATTPLPSAAWTPGTIKRSVNEPTEADRSRTVEETTTVKDQSRTSYSDSAARSSTAVEHTEDSAPLSLPSATPGTIVKSTNQPTQADKTRTVSEVISVKDQTGSEYRESGDRSVVVQRHTENPAALVAPGFAAGTIVTRRNDPTEAGRNQTVDETVIAKDQERTSYEEDGTRSTVRTESTQDATPAPIPGWTAGTIKKSANEPTEYDRTRTIIETITVKNQTRTSYEESGNKSVVRSEQTESPSTIAAAWVPGQIVSARNDPTQADRTRAIGEVVTVKNQSRSSYEEDGEKVASVVSSTESSTPAPAPAWVAGTIKKTMNDPTESGYTRTTVESLTVKDQVRISYEEDGRQSSVQTLNTENASSAVPAWTPGTIVSASNDPTRSDKTRTASRTLTVKDQSRVSYTDDARSSSVVTEHTEAAAPLTIPSASPGTSVRRVNDPTQADKTKTVEEVVTVKNQTGSSATASFHNTMAESTATEAAAAIPAPVAAVGTVRSVSNTPTQYGKISTVDKTYTAVAQKKIVAFTTEWGTSYALWAINQPPGSASADLASYPWPDYETSIGHPTVNEFGLEDYQLTAIVRRSVTDVVSEKVNTKQVQKDEYRYDHSACQWYFRAVVVTTVWKFSSGWSDHNNFKLDCHDTKYGFPHNLKKWVDDIRSSLLGIGRWYYGYARWETPITGWTTTGAPGGEHAELEPQ